MLNWLFKKKPAASPAPVRQMAPAALAAPSQEPLAAPAVDWSMRLTQALGDDTALLLLARQAPSVDTKLAAVEALTTEAALKDAEREFRTHDRRVHRIAKQRLAAAVATRTAREAADRLITSAEALLGEAVIPANRLVSLDRDWQALDAALIEPAQRDRFIALTSRLTAQMHERAEREAGIARWMASARDALDGLQRLSLAVAQGEETPPALVAASDASAALIAAVPPGQDDPSSVDALMAARQVAAQVADRAALLASLDEQGDDVAVLTDRWTSLPPVTASQLARALDQRWEAWVRSKTAPEPVASPQPEKKAVRSRPEPPSAEAVARAEALLLQAEAALAEGQLAEAHRHLTALDDVATPSQRPRLQGLWAEHGRLKGWQQWGGGRARDELVSEAEVLAAASVQPDAKVNARQQADTIDGLRKRWKELDRLGGATSQPLWLRFDAALKTAYEPVAAAQARADAERQANLEAREALLVALEAAPEAETAGWREQVRALDTFQQAWRKLGPIEHTVPHKAREALVARWRAAVARIEAPLELARREAERGREALIERARALVAEGAAGNGRDLIARVRDLQAEWQAHAKTVPLARATENALWSRFKAETDAVFAQREAAFNARDDQLRAHQADREALIGRLQALQEDTPASELKKVLADVDRQWRHAGDVPRQEVARLEAAYRSARDAAQSLLTANAQRNWHATMDALVARRTLCEQRERDGMDADLEAAWQALPPLPALWDRALGARWSGVSATAEASVADDWLLQVEMALDMPSPEAYQAARRERKLQAMKAALESRQVTSTEALDVDDGLARLLAHPAFTPVQRERFDAIVATLRARPR